MSSRVEVSELEFESEPNLTQKPMTDKATKSEQLKIIRLEGENVKAIKAAELSFDEEVNSIVVQGNNAQGKSSLLDLISYAFCGKRELPEQPLSEGEDKGTITVGTSGDIIVERTITETDSYLTVRSKDGRKYQSPQSLLDDLRGQIWADPYKFRSKSARQIREEFLRVIDIDLDLQEWEEKKERIYEERKRAKKKREGLQEELQEKEPDPDLPEETISVQDLIDEISEAEEKNRKKAELYEQADKKKESAHEKELEAQEKREEAQKLIEEADELEEEASSLVLDASVDESTAEEMDVPDVEKKRNQLENLEDKNKRIREKQDYLERQEKLESLKKQVNKYEKKVQSLWSKKREAIEGSDFPVAGLTSTEGELRWNDIPIEQLSQAEKIYLYSALAMAENPSLRCLLIPDASLLDDEWFGKLKDLAREQDYQIFFEAVHDADGDVKIEIREGKVQNKEVEGDNNEGI